MKNIKIESVNKYKSSFKQTSILYITNTETDAAFLENAAIFLREGKTVAFPTETVYGLGADAFNEEAIKNIFLAKGRPSDNPLIVHIANKADVEKLAREIPESAKKLMDYFWPGALTIILKKNKNVPDAVTAGLDTVAIRMPSNEIANQLIKLAGVPVAAPSANISGRPSPTCAEHVIEDLSGKVDCIVAGDNCNVGIESTVIDLTDDVPMILRSGFITKSDVQKQIGLVIEADVADDETIAPKSPGMKYRHYAPNSPLILFMGENDICRQKILSNCYAYEKQGKKIGILTCDENIDYYKNSSISENVILQSMGSSRHIEDIAKNLFYVLRELDTMDVDLILCESFDDRGVGKAVMNRLIKASGGQIIR